MQHLQETRRCHWLLHLLAKMLSLSLCGKYSAIPCLRCLPSEMHSDVGIWGSRLKQGL